MRGFEVLAHSRFLLSYDQTIYCLPKTPMSFSFSNYSELESLIKILFIRNLLDIVDTSTLLLS